MAGKIWEPCAMIAGWLYIPRPAFLSVCSLERRGTLWDGSSHTSVGSTGTEGIHGSSLSPSVAMAQPGGLKRNIKPLRAASHPPMGSPESLPEEHRDTQCFAFDIGQVSCLD